MACTPLNLQTGLFAPVSWSTAQTTAFNGGSVTYTPGGPNPGIVVQKGGGSLFHAQLANHVLKYIVLGNEFVLILDGESGIGPSTRNVSVVNFATMNEVNVINVLASSSAVALPPVAASQGNASAFLAFGQDGTQQSQVAIYRSRDGHVLCSLPAPIVATGQTTAEATATQLIIHYTVSSGSQNEICPKPTGRSQITPASQTFPNVFVGGCPFTPPTKQFTIKNVGDDCLTVNSVTDAAPFTKQSTSQPLPAVLAPNEALTVTVAFNPVGAGTVSGPLAVGLAPANGDSQLVCHGTAQAAQFQIGFSATSLNFGKVPVGGPPKNLQLTITNTGSKPLPVSVPPLSASGFACAGFNGTLNCGQSQPLAVSFAPPAEGPESATLVVSSSAPGSPHSITLSGEGCVPNAAINVLQSGPIDFGDVQQGFRTVRLFEVDNSGDGALTFNGTIGGADAALFGLPDPQGSVTSAPPSRTYSVLPVSPCGAGPSGSGKQIVAVVFFANDAPRMVNATLTLSGHNATNVPASQTWTFPLTAQITPPVAVDVASVVDHSGSMNDPLGSRVKIDAAVAATQLLVQLLRPDLDDRVALVRFNDTPEVVVPMTPVSASTAPTQATIIQKAQTGIPPATGSTAIASGAIVGSQEIDKPRPTTPPLLTRALVVLTDGIENTAYEDPPGSGTWVSILGGQQSKPGGGSVGTAPMSLPAGIKVYAIGLGTDADISPSQLAGLTASDPNHLFRVDQDLTDKKFFQLEKYYTQIFMDVVGTSSIVDPMYWISPGEAHKIEFDVLRGDVDVLIVVYDWEGMRLPFYCVSPAGEVLDPSSIPAGYELRFGATQETRFLEFKMPLKEPDRYAGRWVVVVEHPGRVCFGKPGKRLRERGFLPKECREFKKPVLYGIAIGAGSNFRMTPYVSPAPAYVGDPITLTAVITEAALPVSGCSVTVEATAPDGTTRSLRLYDDGAHDDGGSDDGEYASVYKQTYVPGTYHFEFHALGTSRDGEPVVREGLRDKVVLSHEKDPHPCRELSEVLREHADLMRRYLGERSDPA